MIRNFDASSASSSVKVMARKTIICEIHVTRSYTSIYSLG